MYRLIALLALPVALLADPILATNPAIPGNLQLSTFATGLNFPYGMYQLPDGSLVVATSAPAAANGSLYNSNMQLVRITTTGGVANPPVAIYNGSGGPATGLAGAGNIIAAAAGTGSGSTIQIFSADNGGNLTAIGQIAFTYPAGLWWHNSHAIALQAVPGQPGSYQLLFSVGSQTNDTSTPSNVTVGISGMANQTLAADSLYEINFTINGSTLTAGPATQLADGLRNPYALGFGPNGSIYLADNGQDATQTTPAFPNPPKSSDVFDVIPPGTTSVLHFGFANTYTDPNGNVVGSTAGVTLPVAAFIPLNGQRSQGASGMAMIPSAFGPSLAGGVLVGFTGISDSGGTANPLDPVIWVNPTTGQYFDFILGGQSGLGHPNSFYANSSTLFIADVSTNGSFEGNGAGTGAIYEVSLTSAPEPATLSLFGLAALGLVTLTRNRKQS